MQTHEGQQSVAVPTTPTESVAKLSAEFVQKFKTLEVARRMKPLLLCDEKGGAFYLLCHLDSKELVTKSDLDAVLDASESEEYKLNRQIYTDTYTYQVMERDALARRSFEDLVIEYDPSYRPSKPLKVFGGQHRIKAITVALDKGVSAYHGVRVYFGLTVEQRLDIATVNNTSIAVPSDLLDRMQEEFLGSDLRKWCQSVGILESGQNFADRRSPEGVPTVRLARTLIVNFYRGRSASSFDDFHSPIVCSSGWDLDK